MVKWSELRGVGRGKRIFDRYFSPHECEPELRNWPQTQDALPWFDREDAPDTLNRFKKDGKVNEYQYQLLEKWIEDGYFVVPNLIDEKRINAFRKEVERIWTRYFPYKNLDISDVVIDGEKIIHVKHRDILKLSLEEREEAKRISNWRIGGLHLVAKAAKRIFNDKATNELCELVFGGAAIPRYSLTFHKGSQQLLHQDGAVFHLFPRNNLIGVWIACEDITIDSGPLVYCPKSHREDFFPEFDNYPQTNRRTCDTDTSRRYDEYVSKLATKFENKLFLPKKGDALFWHGQLIHGGHPVENPDTTRLSFVIHFMAKGTDMGAKVVGPFNW